MKDKEEENTPHSIIDEGQRDTEHVLLYGGVTLIVSPEQLRTGHERYGKSVPFPPTDELIDYNYSRNLYVSRTILD